MTEAYRLQTNSQMQSERGFFFHHHETGCDMWQIQRLKYDCMTSLKYSSLTTFAVLKITTGKEALTLNCNERDMFR